MGWYGLVVTTNQKKLYSQHNPIVDNDDEYGRTTDFHTKSHISGLSVWEILQEPSRTADSSDKEWLSYMCKALAT